MDGQPDNTLMQRILHDYEGMSDFRRRVYLALTDVPPGSVVAYGELGKRIGCRSAQAIGQALRHNPFAVGCPVPEDMRSEYGLTLLQFTHVFCVPCHRVIAADGTIGGFSGQRTGDMVERKRQLLAEEGFRFLKK